MKYNNNSNICNKFAQNSCLQILDYLFAKFREIIVTKYILISYFAK
jgi:hypothetical protein